LPASVPDDNGSQSVMSEQCEGGLRVDDVPRGRGRSSLKFPRVTRPLVNQAAGKLVLMDEQRKLLKHFLAALAYRTQKAARGAKPEFGNFSASGKVRTPIELVRHMDSVLGYARTFFIGGEYRPPQATTLEDALAHFHEVVQDLARHIETGADLHGLTPETLLQGPFSDAMTHAGQLAMLRRLSGDPVPPENFIYAKISPDNLGPDQPMPASPDAVWPEKPTAAIED